MNSLFKTILLGTVLTACSNPVDTNTEINSADTVFINGKIYTLDDASPWIEALAITDGKITARGTNSDIKSQIGGNTVVIDLDGKMAMPGINDAHSHMAGGLRELYQCLFSADLSPEEIKPILQACVDGAKTGEFVMGGYWVSSFFDLNDITSPRGWLDEISDEIPIILADDSGHNSWANTPALEIIGFNKEGLTIEGGTIVKGKDGKPNGLLWEATSSQAEAFFNERWTDGQKIAGLENTLSLMSKFGVTGLKDAATNEEDIKFLYDLDNSKGLSAYIAAAQRTFENSNDHTALDFDHHTRIKNKYKSKNLDASHIKFFLDGVPTSSRTAAMTIDYTADPTHPDEPLTRGLLHVEQDDLSAFVIELDKRGFTIKIHAAGDRSVHVALNAVEAARKANGDTGLMHEIAHAGFIVDSDLSRFSELNASPDISPYLWFPSPVMENIRSVLEERAETYFPNRTLMDLGAVITAGSDWPSVSPTVSPWPGIEATVSRKHPDGKAAGVYWPEEKLSLKETLKIFTVNGAKALLIDDHAGALKEGYDGNIIVLNQNLFEIPVDDISETQVEQTWYRGKLVHGETIE